MLVSFNIWSMDKNTHEGIQRDANPYLSPNTFKIGLNLPKRFWGQAPSPGTPHHTYVDLSHQKQDVGPMLPNIKTLLVVVSGV